MDHVILTRFNLPSKGTESVIRAQSGWLEDRVELFERYCLPSVAAQTDRRFSWIIYFDPQSPAWLRQRIEAHSNAHHYVPLFREEVSRTELLGDIEGVVGGRHDELLTTNLDNDDALARDFCERLHAEPRPGATTAYFFANGLVRNAKGLYRHRDPRNAFPSVRAGWTEPVTCWSAWHTVLDRTMEVVELGGAPGWLQVVHARNVSNRTRGRLIAPADHVELFPGLLDDLAPPASSALLHDRLVLRPARRTRDILVRVGKAGLSRVLGRKGIDRVKEAIAARRRSTLV
jgi:hypothetical protein